jgi:ABC-2 type transport system permease protein
MVALFVSLKWRLLTSRLRSGSATKRTLTIIGLVLAGAVAVFVAVGIAQLHRVPDTALVAAELLLLTQLLAWMLSPLLAFGVDETVDPQRFALLPLRRGTMIAGLTAAATIGWLPAVNLILLMGFAVALAPTAAVLPVAVVCMLLQFLMCIVGSRAASTSLADLMSTRRGRDLGMLVGFAVFVLYFGANALLSQISQSQGFWNSLSTASVVLGWTPPGALARIPGLIANGDWGTAGALVLLAVGAIVLGYWWWRAALRRSLESGTSVSESSAPAGNSTMGAAGGVASVVARRDRVLVWRDPMRRLPWLMIAVFMIGMPFIWVRGHGALFTVAFGAVLAGTQTGNQFGVDGSGMWLHMVAIGDRARASAEIVGHLLVAVIPGALLVLVAVPLQAILRGDVALIPMGLAVCWAALLGGAALASLLSAAKPYAMPQSRSSMFASSAPQHKARAFGVSMGVLFGGAAVALPAAAFIFLALDDPWWGWVAMVVGVGVAAGVLVLLVRRAGTIYFEQAPEIFAEVRMGDRV